MRTNSYYFERIIKDFLWRYPSGTIVNMGNSLGNTYEDVRTGNFKWYELDLPDGSGRKIENDDGRIYIHSSICNNDWLEMIDKNGNFLFVAEGIFSLFIENRVKELFSQMCMTSLSFEILFNVISPAGMTIMNYLARNSCRNEALIKWGLYRASNVIRWNPRFILIDNYRAYRDNFPYSYSQHWFLKIFCRWRILHLRIRYNYMELTA